MSLTKFLVKGAVKIGFVGLTAKVIYDLNVFSTNSKETEEKFQKFVTEVVPGTLDLKKQIGVTTTGLPELYNNIVNNLFTKLNYVPEFSRNLVKEYCIFPMSNEKKDK
uniref:MICOS complex subunit MIC13 n=1 Tax=Strongyloides venezuelensis TaxID=75913 RepID=A0A0K0FUS7_STRVS